MSEIFWVDAPFGRLAVLARPRGGDRLEDEVSEWKAQGIDRVVSLLPAEEERELRIQGEKKAVEAAGMSFISFPIIDGGTPSSMSEGRVLIARLVDALKAGESVGVHCRAGIGRSPMIAAAILAASGVSLQTALIELSQARGLPVPETEEQLGWLQEFAGSL